MEEISIHVTFKAHSAFPWPSDAILQTILKVVKKHHLKIKAVQFLINVKVDPQFES